jgi:hypothetical protein
MFHCKPSPEVCDQVLAKLQTAFPEFTWEKKLDGEFYVLRMVNNQAVVLAFSIGKDTVYVPHPENWDEKVQGTEEDQASAPFEVEVHLIAYGETTSTNLNWCVRSAMRNAVGWQGIDAYASAVDPMRAVDQAIDNIRLRMRIHETICTAFPLKDRE